MEEKKQSLEAAEQYSEVEVGEILRRTRVHYGQSLRDVEQILRIRQSQIEAIEKGEIDKLPGRVYAIGFVRSYAEYLGLDGAKVVQLFKQQYMDRQPKEALSFPVPASESKAPPVWLVVFCIILSIGLLFGWAYLQTQQGRTIGIKEIEPLPQEIKRRITENVISDPEISAANTTEPDAGFPGDAATPVQENSAKAGIILNIKGNSWVEIKDGKGAVLVSDVLKMGDQYFVPDSPGLTMSLGNAGGVEIMLNGRPLMPLGKEGDVMRDIPLDTDHLKTLEFQTDNAEAPEALTPAKPAESEVKSDAKVPEIEKKASETEN